MFTIDVTNILSLYHTMTCLCTWFIFPTVKYIQDSSTFGGYVFPFRQFIKSCVAFAGWLLTRPPAHKDIIYTEFETIFPKLYNQVIQFMEPKMEVGTLASLVCVSDRVFL